MNKNMVDEKRQNKNIEAKWITDEATMISLARAWQCVKVIYYGAYYYIEPLPRLPPTSLNLLQIV